MTYESHAMLFSLLLCLEQLRATQSLTPTELGFFVNGIDTSAVNEEDFVFDDKPKWITSKVVGGWMRGECVWGGGGRKCVNE